MTKNTAPPDVLEVARVGGKYLSLSELVVGFRGLRHDGR
jgi:hypothetical protein